VPVAFNKFEDIEQHIGPRRGFDLRPSERLAIEAMLGRLLDANEPSAMLAVLKRIAEHKTTIAIHASDRNEADRWVQMVEALDQVQQAMAAKDAA
jgi:hypothetical protein